MKNDSGKFLIDITYMPILRQCIGFNLSIEEVLKIVEAHYFPTLADDEVLYFVYKGLVYQIEKDEE